MARIYTLVALLFVFLYPLNIPTLSTLIILVSVKVSIMKPNYEIPIPFIAFVL